MRKDDENKWNNYCSMENSCKIISSLINVKYKNIIHIFRLFYLCELHKLSNIALDANERIKDFEIEIPYFGKMSISRDENNNLILKSFQFEDEFYSDVEDVLKTGNSKLLDEAKLKVGEAINKKYKELI